MSKKTAKEAANDASDEKSNDVVKESSDVKSKQDAAQEPTYDDYLQRVQYSDHYSDDEWEYRHVILPKPMLKLFPESYFDPAEPGVLRILSVQEWRDIGIMQSVGWEHYEVHAPEPHILLFRREKNYLIKYKAYVQAQQAAAAQAQAQATTAEDSDKPAKSTKK